jgi:serine/threonine-protein kinase
LRAGLNDNSAPMEGIRFGEFEIDRRDDGAPVELGRGAMGITYRATDTVLNRTVALKVIEAPPSQDGEAVRERFLREARAAAALRHPNIATVFQFGAAPDTDRCYCAMELVEGETLDARVRRDGPVTVEFALEIAVQVTRALIAAAERGLVHRDLKPSNIMLTGSGPVEIKVIDFGLAKATTSAEQMELTHGGFVGTPAFASPEQFGGGAIDARTDIYALGVTLWFGLTGRLPFAGATIEEIRARQAKGELPLEQLRARGVPASLCRLLQSCLAIDPAQRPASARDLLGALENCRAATTQRRRTRVLGAAAGICVLVLAIVASVVLSRTNRARERTTNAAPAPASEKRVAILPFRSLAPTGDGQILGVGMADSLITKLSASRQIAVSSLATVRKYAEVDRDAVEAGRELNVSMVLEGNVQRVGDQIRVTARLINVADGAALWTGTFDENFTDVFAVQDTIALKVADALAVQLTGEESNRLIRRATENMEAYRLYLTGRFHWGKLAPPEIRKSIGYFESAIELDPNYALAYFGLADAYRALSMIGDLRPNDTYPQASAAARKAIELDPTLAEPYVTLAFVQSWYEWDWAGAERSARRAVDLNPNLAFAHAALSLPLHLTGRVEEAMAAARRGQQLDPVSPPINTIGASSFIAARRDAEAAEMLQRAIELNPRFWLSRLFLGQLYTRQGKYREALAELDVAVDTSHGNSDAVSMRAYVWAITGERAKAQAVLDELLQTSAQRYVPPWSIAVVYHGLGDVQQTFFWLEKGLEERDPHLTFLGSDAKWDPLRSAPRFVQILERLGLAAAQR